MAHHRPSSRRKHKVWPWITGVLVLLLALVVAVGVVVGMKLLHQAQEVKDHENRAIASLSGLSDDVNDQTFAKIRQTVPQIQQETKSANDIAHGSLWNFAAKLPFVGNDIKTVQGMTSIINSITSESVPNFIGVIDSLQKANLSNGDGINLQPIQDAQAKLKTANTTLQAQVQQYNSLEEPTISQIKTAYDQGGDKLNEIADKVKTLSNSFDMLPKFLGSGKPQTYAVMAMTTSEMRSSGGLIGSVGEMTTDNGVIHVGEFKSNTEYIPFGSGDHSDDMNRVFTAEGPLNMSFDIRDLAVFPDTHQIAESMQSIWKRTPWGQNQALDGVVTVDPVFVQELVKISGNVTLPNGVALTKDNTAEYLLNTVYKQYGDDNNATDAVFGAAASQVLGNLFKNVNVKKLVSIGQILSTMAQERHFSIYVFNPELEKTIQEAGFTASTPSSEENPSVGIYLTEQNPSKMGWYIKRTARITTVDCNASGSTYHVEYTLYNTLQKSQVTQLPRYITSAGVDYGIGIEKILFYPPKGGSIMNITQINGTVDAVKEDTIDGKKVFRSLVYIQPGQQVTYSFDVSVSTKATAPLTIDQTPMGWTGNGITYSEASCIKREK